MDETQNMQRYPAIRAVAARMQQFQSHKVVRAARITSVVKTSASVTDPHFLVNLDTGDELELPREMTARYEPQPGDRLVVYEDGYASISPQAAFEGGYTAYGPRDGQPTGGMK